MTHEKLTNKIQLHHKVQANYKLENDFVLKSLNMK